MNETDHFLQTIDAFLAKNPKLSDRAISERATSNVDTIRNVRRSGKMPKERNLAGIAAFLGISVNEMLGRESPTVAGNTRFPRSEAKPADLGDVSRLFREMPRNIAVRGTALGHNICFDGNGSAEIETTLFEMANEILYVARPPALMGIDEAYAFYVQGDSMAPAHEDGALRFANPRLPVRATDYVVVQLRAPVDDGQDGEQVVCVLLKRLVRRSGSHATLEQFNPPLTFKVPNDRIKAIHRVMEMDDLFNAPRV